jgi:hypothetical protein
VEPVSDGHPESRADALETGTTVAPGTTAGELVGVGARALRAVLLTLAEHHSELLQIGELDDDDTGFTAAVACWQLLFRADANDVADMLGALRVFGCGNVVERIVDAIDVRADHDFEARQRRAETRHRSRLLHPSSGNSGLRLHPGRAPLPPGRAVRDGSRARVAHNN